MTEKVENPPPASADHPVKTVNSIVNEQPAGHRVFIGNLSYQTRESELREFCSQIGNVLECKIVFRGPRSLGFGFVSFENEAEADKAIEVLKDKELDSRTINVEKAVPKDQSSRPRRGRGGFRGGYRYGGEYRRGSFRGRRGSRRPASERSGEPSKTTVFVGNLPFIVIDQDLYNIFEAFKVEKAHVVRRRNGASRGYGFVTLASEQEQKKALEELAEVWCDDHKLVVRAAMSDDAHGSEENGATILGSAVASKA